MGSNSATSSVLGVFPFAFPRDLFAVLRSRSKRNYCNSTHQIFQILDPFSHVGKLSEASENLKETKFRLLLVLVTFLNLSKNNSSKRCK